MENKELSIGEIKEIFIQSSYVSPLDKLKLLQASEKDLPTILKEVFENWPPGNRTEEEKYIDSLKMAFVFVNENDKDHTSLRVSNIDMKAYNYKDYYETILPLEEVPYFSFDRWWRSMDF